MDFLSPEDRSAAMRKVRSKDTSIEMLLRSHLHKRGLRFRKHAKDLPGRPDVVFRKERVAVFIDGDFWHGYRCSTWIHKLSPYWRDKILQNRARDTKNFRKLRRLGWKVVRVWQHEIRRDLEAVGEKIARHLPPDEVG